MKITILLSSLFALIAMAFSLRYLHAARSNIGFYAATAQIQKTIFEKEGNDELRKAYLRQISADKDRGVDQTIGCLLIYSALGFTGINLVLSGFLLARQRGRASCSITPSGKE